MKKFFLLVLLLSICFVLMISCVGAGVSDAEMKRIELHVDRYMRLEGLNTDTSHQRVYTDTSHQRVYTNTYIINGEYYYSTTVMNKNTDNRNCRTEVIGNYTKTVCR